GLRQDRRQRQPAPADVLPRLRHADLCRSRSNRCQGGLAAPRRGAAAGRANAARSILVSLSAALAVAALRAHEARHATGRKHRRQRRCLTLPAVRTRTPVAVHALLTSLALT